MLSKKLIYRTSLVIQWLRLHTSSVAVMGLIHGEGTKIPQAIQYGQSPPTKKEKKTNLPQII